MPPRAMLPPRIIARWLREGWRTLLLRPARWHELEAAPLTVLMLFALGTLCAFGVQRWWVMGPASVQWEALLAGWLLPAATGWVGYALVYPGNARTAATPTAAQLVSLVIVQGWMLSTIYGGIWALLMRSGNGPAHLPPALAWAVWIGFWLWLATAQTIVFWRATRYKACAVVASLLLLAIALTETGARKEEEMLWVAEVSAASTHHEAPAPLKLTQEILEQQPRVLERRLRELHAQRPGIVDLYALTFAPYAHEDVFRRESSMVAEVLAERFDSGGRTLQLVNHTESVREWPWATPLNLQRAIRHIARLMDRNEDVLFLHLTSHGAQNGELAAHFWPLTMDAVTPQQLRKWLDDAGIHNRVISISACYSGSWIEPLRNEGTLVMTAADADHTSYGCGRRSELTFFGRAVFDEQLRKHTRSFEQAHAAARPLIEQREQAAGKDDGYSNPQIAVGARVRERLERLRSRLEQG